MFLKRETWGQNLDWLTVCAFISHDKLVLKAKLSQANQINVNQNVKQYLSYDHNQTTDHCLHYIYSPA